MTPVATGVPTTPFNAEADLAMSVRRIREAMASTFAGETSETAAATASNSFSNSESFEESCVGLFEGRYQ